MIIHPPAPLPGESVEKEGFKSEGTAESPKPDRQHVSENAPVECSQEKGLAGVAARLCNDTEIATRLP